MKRVGVLILLFLFSGVARASDWPVFGRDAARSGTTSDQAITIAKVTHLRERWHIALGDVADSAPIVVGNSLFQTSKNGTTFAVNTGTGRILWRFTTRGPNITTSVPAYDESSHRLYAPGVDGYLHQLDPSTGQEIRGHGFPVQITMAPETEKNASSLNIANGYLYAQTSGYFGDATPYVGHVIAIRLSDGKRTVFNSLCSNRHILMYPQACTEQRAGMWSRSGVVVDPDPSMRGRIYVTTGNGPFDASKGAYGDSVLSISSDASRLLGYYTPENFSDLELGDVDLGSTSPALLPRQPTSSTPLMAVQGGKDRTLRLLDRAHLGGVGHELQTLDLSGKLFGAPAVWSDKSGTVWIFIDVADGIHAYQLQTIKGKSKLVGAWYSSVNSSYEGSTPAVSNGLVFVAGDGSLIALNAQNGRQLWSHTIGQIHWESPVVANGSVYCSDEAGDLAAFALM